MKHRMQAASYDYCDARLSSHLRGTAGSVLESAVLPAKWHCMSHKPEEAQAKAERCGGEAAGLHAADQLLTKGALLPCCQHLHRERNSPPRQSDIYLHNMQLQNVFVKKRLQNVQLHNLSYHLKEDGVIWHYPGIRARRRLQDAFGGQCMCLVRAWLSLLRASFRLRLHMTRVMSSLNLAETYLKACSTS